jgi:medium-chain acyl-[acyl-carrier-protein] hydrolase
MAEPSHIYQSNITARSFECDINRRWKPASFFQHLTEAAGHHAEKLGCGFDVMYARGFFWVHSRMKIKFFRFPVDGEAITITTWPKTIQQKLFFVRDYQIHAENGEQLAAASSAWLVISASERRIVPPLSTGLDLPCIPEKAALDEPLERLSVGDDGEERLRLTANYSAIDMLGHVNNSRYVEWICDTFPIEAYKDMQLDWMQINYDKEIRPGELVAVTQHQPDGSQSQWAVNGVNISNGTKAFEAVGQWKMV